jgi:uncharacterized protein
MARILAVDGGGIRGIIPATVLAEVERRTGRRVFELFDLIAGTSTGGILACALTRPADDGVSARFTAEELIDLYVSEGPRIFHRDLLKRITSIEGWIDERYDDAGLDGALQRYLGGARLRDALTPIMVTAYDLEGRFAFFFRSARAVDDSAYDYAMWQVARATSAAPTYFEPARVTDAAGEHTYTLVDGGVFAVNPSMCAYADVAPHGSVDLVVSLGTGGHTRPIPYRKARGWGQLEWARPIIDVVFDGAADTVDFQTSTLVPDGGYIRLQTELTQASDALDDASPANLAALQAEAAALVEHQSAAIDDLCERLTTSV